jgi:hypothetical protein
MKSCSNVMAHKYKSELLRQRASSCQKKSAVLKPLIGTSIKTAAVAICRLKHELLLTWPNVIGKVIMRQVKK